MWLFNIMSLEHAPKLARKPVDIKQLIDRGLMILITYFHIPWTPKIYDLIV